MTETPAMVDTQPRSHDYHAEAHVLSGDLQRPIEQKIEQHAPVALKDRRGGHLTRFAEEVSIEGLITFAKGHTRVSGARSLKHKGWITLSTSVVEGLNVFEIITADRVVSQISTDHPYEKGHVPQVTFLGTQFRNLQVSGFPVTLTLNLGICGERPPDDRSYLRSSKFLNTVKEQTQAIAKADGLPKELKERYDKKLSHINKLISTCDTDERNHREPVTCSLVQSIGAIPIPGVQIFGNVIVIPEFGSVALGEVTVGESSDKRESTVESSPTYSPYFELTGIHMRLGCVGHGTASAATVKANGQSYP
jgi:hypothetical protein